MAACSPWLENSAMPQIWMTYDELAGLLDCDSGAAREIALIRQWHRRRSSDGQTRVKLPPAVAGHYIEAEAARREREGAPPMACLDDSIEKLRDTAARMRTADRAGEPARWPARQAKIV
jgi:hypothetical protein